MPAKGRDIASDAVGMQRSSSFYKALAYENLFWKFNNQTYTMASGPKVAWVGLPVWVQSTTVDGSIR